MIQRIFLLALVVFAQNLFASGGHEATLNWYHSLAETFGVHDVHALEAFAPIASACLTFLLILVFGLLYKRSVDSQKDAAPDGKVSVRTFVETLLDIVYSIGKDNCGDGYRKYLPLLGGLFLFIFLNNLTGLIPGLPPATENISVNLAMGLSVFLVYNLAGVKEHGVSYLKHFMGPMLVLAPLFIVIELISHSARPFSLSLRLMGNIFADHLMLGEFSKLTYVIVPSILMFFGLLVALVQSFIFTLLTGIYISMATSHDH